MTKTRKELRDEAAAKCCRVSECIGKTVTGVYDKHNCLVVTFGDVHCLSVPAHDYDDLCLEDGVEHVDDHHLIDSGIISAEEYKAAIEFEKQQHKAKEEDRERAEYERLREKFDGKP